jgi:hypothetical protein
MASVTLSKPVSIFGKTVGSVELNEPNGGQFVRLGEPRTLVFNQSGSGYWVENGDAIRGYLELLIGHEAGGEVIMSLVCLQDALEIKEALFSFFSDAAGRLAAKRSTPSSSAST